MRWYRFGGGHRAREIPASSVAVVGIQTGAIFRDVAKSALRFELALPLSEDKRQIRAGDEVASLCFPAQAFRSQNRSRGKHLSVTSLGFHSRIGRSPAFVGCSANRRVQLLSSGPRACRADTG